MVVGFLPCESFQTEEEKRERKNSIPIGCKIIVIIKKKCVFGVVVVKPVSFKKKRTVSHSRLACLVLSCLLPFPR